MVLYVVIDSFFGKIDFISCLFIKFNKILSIIKKDTGEKVAFSWKL